MPTPRVVPPRCVIRPWGRRGLRVSRFAPRQTQRRTTRASRLAQRHAAFPPVRLLVLWMAIWGPPSSSGCRNITFEAKIHFHSIDCKAVISNSICFFQCFTLLFQKLYTFIILRSSFTKALFLHSTLMQHALFKHL